MINAIGVGISPFVDLSKRRYGRICIVTDQDIDGSHIANLVIFAFARFLPEVILNNMLYIAYAPIASEVVNGKKVYYQTMEELRNRKTKGAIKYYKGLGSMDDDDLAYCVCDYKTARWALVKGDMIPEVLELGKSTLRKKSLMQELGIIE